MNSAQLSSSQFADNCKIPRPTVSQILNGRNKKISDEIISKIHSTYPSLSMLWLMFGEGNMMLNSNIEISEPQKYPTIDFDYAEDIDNEPSTPSLDFNNEIPQNLSENLNINFESSNQSDIINNSETQHTNEKKITTITPDANKQIVNIMVFYSDNSFESFQPVSAKK